MQSSPRPNIIFRPLSLAKLQEKKIFIDSQDDDFITKIVTRVSGSKSGQHRKIFPCTKFPTLSQREIFAFDVTNKHLRDRVSKFIIDGF